MQGWLVCCLLVAGLLVVFITRVGGILRERDARLAELRGTTVERIGEITSANFTRLFPRVSS